MSYQVVEYPVPVGLKKILKDRSSGELIVRGETFEKSLFFNNGSLVYARSNVIQERLGEILFKMGKIDRAQFWNIHRLMENKMEKVGKILVQNNILNQRDLFLALRHQIKTIALSLFALDAADWDFLTKTPEVPDDGNFTIELPEIITEGMSILKNTAFFKNRFYYHSPQVSAIPQSIRNYLSREEIQFHRMTANFKNLSNERLISELNIPEDVYWRNIVLLFLLNIVEFAEIEAAREIDRSIDEIIGMYEKLKSDKVDYFELFGLRHDASFEEIKDVYFRFAKKYHPDRIANAPDPEIKERANFVFSEINKAYDTLSSEEKKRAYLEKGHPDAGDDIASAKRLEKARILYRKARTLHAQKKYWEAASLLEEAVRLDKDKASYFLLLGLSQLNVPTMRRMAEKNLQRAVELEPWNVEAYAALGLLFQAENQLKRAEGFFRKVLSINPDHALARRKIMEIEGGDKKKQRFSLFGKSKK